MDKAKRPIETVNTGEFFPLDSTQAIGWEDLTDVWWIAYKFREDDFIHCATRGQFESQESAQAECTRLNQYYKEQDESKGQSTTTNH